MERTKRPFDLSQWRTMEFLSTTQVAQILGVSYNSAAVVVRTIPFVRIGKTIRVKRESLEKWIRDQERESKSTTWRYGR